MSERIIRASEIGQYDFCAKAWWLGAIDGVPAANTAELQAGTHWHAAHSRVVNRARHLQQGAVMLVALGVILLALFLITNGL